MQKTSMSPVSLDFNELSFCFACLLAARVVLSNGGKLLFGFAWRDCVGGFDASRLDGMQESK